MAPSETGHPDVIALRRSNLLLAWLVLASAGAFVLTLLYLPGPLAVVLGILIAWRAWIDARRHALRFGADAVTALRLSETGIECLTRSGTWRAGEVLASGLVSPMLTVFRWRQQDDRARPSTVVVLPDALDDDAFRRLRVYLRWKRQ